MTSILRQILQDKRDEIDRLKASTSIEALKQAELKPRGFRDALLSAPSHSAAAPSLISAAATPPVPVIAEVKKASPSKGVIRADFDAVEIARSYAKGGARCLSVLTDKKYFQGELRYLEAIRSALPELRLLRKDFLVDPIQVWESRARGADAALLIVAALTDKELGTLFQECMSAGLDILIEVHDEKELERAARLPLENNENVLLGINNRDLNTFQVDCGVSVRLAEVARRLFTTPPPIISESGIETSSDIDTLRKAGISGFLVGEALMRSGDPGENLRLLTGQAR